MTVMIQDTTYGLSGLGAAMTADETLAAYQGSAEAMKAGATDAEAIAAGQAAANAVGAGGSTTLDAQGNIVINGASAYFSKNGGLTLTGNSAFAQFYRGPGGFIAGGLATAASIALYASKQKTLGMVAGVLGAGMLGLAVYSRVTKA
jgi:hypothetical protein